MRCSGLHRFANSEYLGRIPFYTLHRIAFPVVSDWYQWRHNCLTIVLGCGTHMKDVQHHAR